MHADDLRALRAAVGGQLVTKVKIEVETSKEGIF